MNFMYKYLEFNTIEEGKNNLREVREIARLMEVGLCDSPLTEGYRQIKKKIRTLTK